MGEVGRRLRAAAAVIALTALAAACVDFPPFTTQPPAAGSAQPSGVSVSSGSAQSGAAATGAGSIAFVKAGDVWISGPDGSAARQLTTDGSGTPYYDPAQTPDGNIFALRGSSQLVLLDRRTGTQIATSTLPTLENGAEGLIAAPDGQHIAYVTTGFGQTIDPRFGTPSGAFIYGGTDVAAADGTSVPNSALATMTFPTWYGPEALAVSDGVKLYVANVGEQPQPWIDKTDGCLTDFDCPAGQDPAANVSEPSLSRDGKVVAYTYKPYFGNGARLIARLDQPPPQAPTETCALPGHQTYSDPGAFSPDASAFAYDDTTFNADTLETTVGQGIFVLSLDYGRADCGLMNAALVIPGGAQPDWGPVAP